MEHRRDDAEFEMLSAELHTPESLAAYKEPLDHHPISTLPRLLGRLLVWSGSALYGKKPSLLKFRAIEVIARVPYHSWTSASYTLLTLFYGNEAKALALSRATRYARLAQDNETMHVVVISTLAKTERAGLIRFTLIPLVFAFFYFWASYLLYLIRPRYSYELNYLFEDHAFEQYNEYIETHADLRDTPIESAFLEWYGRHPRTQYEFFCSVRNDELIHRNSSIHQITQATTQY